VLRNRKATDYDAYLRNARDAYYRTNRPYGSPYQSYYGNTTVNPTPPQSEPFEEFSGGGSSTDGGKSNEDDLFD
jgi:hypothetical protein